MKLATWNVNSIRARRDRALRWLEATAPDVVCLQELKATRRPFPSRICGGPATTRRSTARRPTTGSPYCPGPSRGTWRRASGTTATTPRPASSPRGWRDVTVASAYVPNGAEVGSDKWTYKLDWLRRLRGWLDRPIREDRRSWPCAGTSTWPRTSETSRPVRVGDERALSIPRPAGRSRTCAPGDSWTPSASTTTGRGSTRGGTTACWASPGTRACASITSTSASRWPDRCTGAFIDRDERKGKQPSDHAPVVVELDV